MHRGAPGTGTTRQPTGHRALSMACPGFLTVPQGGMSAPPAIRKAAEFLRRETLRYVLRLGLVNAEQSSRLGLDHF